MEEFDLNDYKEDQKWARKAFLTVGCVIVAIVALCGILFGKVVEESLFAEIAK